MAKKALRGTSKKEKSRSLEPQPPRLSTVEMVQQVLPGDTNHYGTVFGGRVMDWIDICGAVAAMRHVRGMVVTVSFDRVDFHAPAHNGDIMILKSQVNYTGRTSLEVGVEVHAENPLTGERVLTTDAFLTFVAVDKNGKPVPVPALLPETSEEKRRFKEGAKRRRLRLTEKKSRL